MTLTKIGENLYYVNTRPAKAWRQMDKILRAQRIHVHDFIGKYLTTEEDKRCRCGAVRH